MNAVVFAEHDRRVDLEKQYHGLRLDDVRHYGDTAVSVFRLESKGENTTILETGADSEGVEGETSQQ